MEFIIEFIGDFIVEFWLQLTQPNRKGLPKKKQQLIFNIGIIAVSLLMCILLVYFIKTGNMKGGIITFLLIVIVIEIALISYAVYKRKNNSSKSL